MTDPWTEFAASVDRSENAGYLEGRFPDGRPGRWSLSFRDPKEVLEVRDESSFSDWASGVGRAGAAGSSIAVAGYMGFDAARLFDRAVGPPPPGSPFPLGEFALIDRPRLRLLRAPAAAARRPIGPQVGHPLVPRSDSLDRARYRSGVRRLKSAIRAGEAYQVVLAHRREFPRPTDLPVRAGLLRRRERYAFFFYLKFGDREVVGATPESVVEARGSRAFISPIAGTRPRGHEPRRRALRRDPKELAEHRMLVDLARNDLGRVARPGTVRIVERERLERFARVEHLVSRVVGTMERSTSPARLLAAAFPAGTVTGAPKIRATELLRGVERTWRGPYGGAVGVVRGRSLTSWELAIRSAFSSRERLYTAAGAGIVVGSRPGQEFDETMAKLAQVEASLAGAAPP